MGIKRNYFILIPILFLMGCASSGVSREAAHQVDKSYASAENSYDISSANPGGAYQNASQMAKGALLGGAGGAIIGATTSGIGVIPGAAGGALLGAAYGKYIDHYVTLADQLENRHVKVFVLGDQIKIVLHSNEVFYERTSAIDPSAYSTLDIVAQYISSYRNMSVGVVAYTSDSMPKQFTLALSRDQANSIVKYLWRRGVNTRFIYGIGADGSRLVSVNSPDWNNGENYRVEINLEKLPY